MKTVKLASCRYLDDLPTHGSEDGHAFRDLDMEKEVHKLTQSLGVGAQFGGKYFCHDVRVIRLPAPRRLAPDRARRFVLRRPPGARQDHAATASISRSSSIIPRNTCPTSTLPSSAGMWSRSTCASRCDEILAQLSKYPIRTRLSLTGPMIVARDLAHAKLRERLEKGEGLPDYFKNHPIYYAGPPRRRRATLRARSVRPPLAAWIRSSQISRLPADQW